MISVSYDERVRFVFSVRAFEPDDREPKLGVQA